MLILGAGGLIGQAITRQLCADPGAITSLMLADRVPLPAPAGPIPVHSATGDISDGTFVSRLLASADCVVHLAALLATETEADLDRGMDVNLRGLIGVLDGCRAQSWTAGRVLRFVFTSSIAAFGGPLPEMFDDAVARTPQTSYGTHKAIAELLIDDYTRRGVLDGRVLRLPIVLGRDALSGTAVSDKVAALVRDPVLGRDMVCGIHPDTIMPVASAHRVAAALLRVAALPAEVFGHTRAMNLPSLSVTARELAEAASRGAVHRPGRVSWLPEPALQAVIEGWPRRFGSAYASGLGLASDINADEIVRHFLHDIERG